MKKSRENGKINQKNAGAPRRALNKGNLCLKEINGFMLNVTD